jgi:hypothetical protein
LGEFSEVNHFARDVDALFREKDADPAGIWRNRTIIEQHGAILM